MTMQVRIKPVLRNNAILISNKTLSSFNVQTPYLILSSEDSTPYSFLCKIVSVEDAQKSEDETTSLPILEVDKRLVGGIPIDDIVEILPYNLPLAKKIVIGIDQSYLNITPGNWTSTLQSYFLDAVVDYNHTIKAALNYDNKNMILRGRVINSEPSLPVLIDSGTQFIIEKYPSALLDQFAHTLEDKKITRFTDFHQSQKSQLLEKLNSLDLPLTTLSVKFKIDKHDFDFYNSSFQSLFYHHSHKDMRTYQEGQKSYSKSLFYKIVDEKITEIVDYTFVGSNSDASLILKIHLPSKEDLNHRKTQLQKEILKINESLSKKNRIGGDVRVQFFILGYLDKNSENNAQIPLAALYHDFREEYPDEKISEKKFTKTLKRLEKHGFISELEKLPTGYFMVHLHPPELTKDPITMLQFAKGNPELTRQELITGLGWAEHRVTTALDFLQEKQLVKRSKSFRTGEKYFFQL